MYIHNCSALTPISRVKEQVLEAEGLPPSLRSQVSLEDEEGEVSAMDTDTVADAGLLQQDAVVFAVCFLFFDGLFDLRFLV